MNSYDNHELTINEIYGNLYVLRSRDEGVQYSVVISAKIQILILYSTARRETTVIHHTMKNDLMQLKPTDRRLEDVKEHRQTCSVLMLHSVFRVQ